MSAGNVYIGIRGDTKPLEKSLDKAKSSAVKSSKKIQNAIDKNINRGVTKAKTGVSSLKAGFIALGGAAAAVGFVRIASDITKVGVAFDSLGRSYKSIFGSTKAAGEELKYVNDIAKDFGLNLIVVEESFKNISAAAKDTALEGEGVHKIFKAISGASAALGMSADQTSGALTAISQMISKGNVQAEELRGQLGERLPGAFQLSAKAMGVTTAELGKMLEQGQVAATDLLPKLADVLENQYGKAAVEAGKSSRASFENLSTAILELKRTIASSGLVEMLADMANMATKMVQALSASKDLTMQQRAQIGNDLFSLEEKPKSSGGAGHSNLEDYQSFFKSEKKTASSATSGGFKGFSDEIKAYAELRACQHKTLNDMWIFKIEGEKTALEQEKAIYQERADLQKKLSEEKLAVAEKEQAKMVAITTEANNQIDSSFANSFQGMVKSLADGSKNMGDIAQDLLSRLADSFLDYAMSVAKSQLLMSSNQGGGTNTSLWGALIKGVVGGLSSSGSVIDAGGVNLATANNLGFANGGISTGSSSGHMELLHGREAVVPLSGGRGIPVDLQGSGDKGGGSTVNNITIQAMDSKSFTDFFRGNPGALVAAMTDQANRGNNGLKNAIQKAAR